uniref:Uncharacterized protein n=1 Tax=Arundo donax TaxID=35708 RepID=A0A0A9CBT7_ARUDO
MSQWVGTTEPGIPRLVALIEMLICWLVALI